MLILSDPSAFHPDAGKPLVLAIGNFDGLHLGHQKLLSRVVERARALSGLAAVLTFREHPQHVLHPSSKPPLLSSQEHKLFLLEEAGLDLCFILPFTPQFSYLEPEAFVKDLLVGRLGVREVYLGRNARFGRDRKGDAALMRSLAAREGFAFDTIDLEECAGGMVSSSQIRDLIREGSLEEARKRLGRPFSVFGRVVKGDGRGSKIGFPTANLEVASEILPPFGVYPVRVREAGVRRVPEKAGTEKVEIIRGPWLQGVLNYGFRPTFDKKQGAAVPEVHILDFTGDLYGKGFEVVFYSRIRGERAFPDVEALKNQIKTDIEEARLVLSRVSGGSGTVPK